MIDWLRDVPGKKGAGYDETVQKDGGVLNEVYVVKAALILVDLAL
jgi:hypothetical protein